MRERHAGESALDQLGHEAGGADFDEAGDGADELGFAQTGADAENPAAAAEAALVGDFSLGDVGFGGAEV